PLGPGHPAAPPSYYQQCGRAAPGGAASGWVQWSSQAPAAVTRTPSASFAKALRFNAGSGNGARAWRTDTLPADLEASASVRIENLVRSELFVRGHGLDTPAPTYY